MIRMGLGIRGKLFLLSLGLITATLVMAELALTPSLERELTQNIHRDLEARGKLLKREVQHQIKTLNAQPSNTLTTLTHELSQQAHLRLTLVAPDGRVLGDSDLTESELLRIENHGERPEIKAALQGQVGTSIRQSTTLDHRMMYVALPLQQDQQTLGVLRVALPLSHVDQSIWRLRELLIGASLLALGVTALISTLAAHRISRTLRMLAHSARRMTRGELDERTHAPGSDEIATLGQSLDQLAMNLAEALRQLKNERDLLEGILEGMQEGVLVLDRNNRVRHANPALREMLVIGPDAIGKPLLEVIRNAELADIFNKARAHQSPESGEVDQTGLKPRRLQVQAAPLPGEPGNLLAVLVDVTQLRRLESLRKDFVANASHELRTPVASVRSAAETLRTAMDDPEAAVGFLDMIERNATRLHLLVEDLLDLSRIESREFRLQWCDLELASFTQNLLDTYQPLAQPKAIHLEMGVPEDMKAQVDRRALEQILGNLLDNAIKYCPTASTIRIEASLVTGQSTQGDAPGIRMQVVDNGPGIPRMHLSRLFERFYRVDPGRSRALGGTGLGLAIVKHLVEAMGGKVSVESEVGKGSCFAFTLKNAHTHLD